MNKKIIYIFILLLIVFISGCVSTPDTDSGIWVTSLSESVTRYYIPATTWQEKTSRSVSCRIDMTYLDEPERPVVCNISFFNNSMLPKEISSVYFIADGINYPLINVTTMFTRTERNEHRITSIMEIDKLLKIFNAENFLMIAIIDSTEYTFEPNNEFLRYSRQFYNYCL